MQCLILHQLNRFQLSICIILHGFIIIFLYSNFMMMKCIVMVVCSKCLIVYMSYKLAEILFILRSNSSLNPTILLSTYASIAAVYFELVSGIRRLPSACSCDYTELLVILVKWRVTYSEWYLFIYTITPQIPSQIRIPLSLTPSSSLSLNCAHIETALQR